MNAIEPLAAAWAARGWLALLAFTAAVLLVAVLRKPCRRGFGAERAFQLWLLPPLAVLASQLPHVVATPTALPPLVYAITSAVGTAQPAANAVAGFDGRSGALLLWLAGVVLVLASAMVAQRRYRERLRDATPVSAASVRRPVLLAATAGVGPALVGAWRSRIVLPADFHQRYDAIEQALILAHEDAHARRGDGGWSLLAHALAALFWCHPLAWWALAALRHDQELACDAAVLREHGAQRRSYANAMLKTQPAVLALPVGCRWSPRHPLTERIAMLKLSSPSRQRRNAGAFVGFVLAVVVAGSVYAASAPQGAPANQEAQNPTYELDMRVELATDDGHKRHADTVDFALCVAPGKPAMASVGDFRVEATTAPAGDGQVRIDFAVSKTGVSPLARNALHGALGKTLHVAGEAVDGRPAYAIDITPQAGCPARVLAEASPIKVTEHVNNGAARRVAESVAAKAGWTLVNPDALGHAVVTVSFNNMPAGTALQRVAELAGMKLILDGRLARFEPK